MGGNEAVLALFCGLCAVALRRPLHGASPGHCVCSVARAKHRCPFRIRFAEELHYRWMRPPTLCWSPNKDDPRDASFSNARGPHTETHHVWRPLFALVEAFSPATSCACESSIQNCPSYFLLVLAAHRRMRNTTMPSSARIIPSAPKL